MPGNFLNSYFGFNKEQRNGLLILVLVSFVLLLIRLIYPYFITPGKIVVLDLPLVERRLDSIYKTSGTFSKKKFKDENKNAHLFVFDPNTVSEAQLFELGFREKTVGIFLKFRDKGFKFKKKEDIKKVYGISDKFYVKLEPYIFIEEKKSAQIASTGEEKKTEIVSRKVPSPKIVELNSADSLGLTALSGIGATYAKRILKYRDILGGYISTEQLTEVFGFTPELYEKIKNSVSVNSSSIRKINLNKDEFKVINKHPYLTFELTKTIFNFRRKTSINPGNFKDLLNDNSLYQKLLPYLAFE